MINKDLISIVEETSKRLNLNYQILNFGERSYPLYYGEEILSQIGELFQHHDIMGRILIVSHPQLRNLFGERVEKSLAQAGYVSEWVVFPIGEQYKNMTTLSQLYESCVKARINKSSAIIALGGGVVQDITNYLSATYMRGVPFVQIPTTLLSQADVGMGGCAIDHPAGKSLIGQFYQPRLVVMDSSVLNTLPETEVTNGIAEIINKVMCLGGAKTEEIEKDIHKIKLVDWQTLREYIKLSNIVKKNIIEEDETGLKGLRFILDWGHTITYALERVLDYSVSHGWALGIGMHGAAMLSYQLGYLGKNKVNLLEKTIESAGLPTKLPANIQADELIKYINFDQKVKDGKKRFILLRDFGDAFISEYVSDKQIINCLNFLI